jgi:hypothetical protein
MTPAEKKGYRMAINDLKKSGISVTRGECFAIVVHLEKRMDERCGKVKR